MAKPWIYADTSAFLKLFVKETGTERMRRLTREHRLLASAVITVESRSALARRRRDGDVSEPDFERIMLRMTEGLLAIEMVRVTDEVLVMAGDIVVNWPARTMDALHIASALIFQRDADSALTFVTADKKQYETAESEGLHSVLLA